MARKDISDRQVCQAYEQRRVAMIDWADDAITALSKIERGEALPTAPWPYETLMRDTGQCFKVCYRAMERAYDHGLIEYGTSLRSGWLTNKGKELLS